MELQADRQEIGKLSLQYMSDIILNAYKKVNHSGSIHCNGNAATYLRCSQEFANTLVVVIGKECFHLKVFRKLQARRYFNKPAPQIPKTHTASIDSTNLYSKPKTP